MNDYPRLSVIVPTFRSLGMLRQCADGLLSSDFSRSSWEFIVVDDGSRDGTIEAAREFADSVLEDPEGPHGPAAARNIGAVAARGDILVFVDSDVVVSPTTLAAIAKLFDNQPTVAAAFGTYDDAPAVTTLVSQYRNLLHRYVHLQNQGEATSFWAGCGAVRRTVFLAVGGFDAARYPRPQIEDIELGYRLRAEHHRIVLDASITGKHLKRWSFTSMIRTDFRDRAVPWMHLLLDRNSVADNGELNLGASEKVLTLCAGLALFFIFLTVFDVRFGFFSAIFVSIIIAGNARLISWFAMQRGWLFALAIVPLRLLYYVVGGLGAAWALLTHGNQPTFAAPPPLPNYHRRPATS